MKIKIIKCSDRRWWYAKYVGQTIESAGKFLPWMNGTGLLVHKYHNVIKEGDYSILNTNRWYGIKYQGELFGVELFENEPTNPREFDCVESYYDINDYEIVKIQVTEEKE